MEKPWDNLVQKIRLPTVLIKSVTLQSICTSSSPTAPCQVIHLNLKRSCTKDGHASLCEFPQSVCRSKCSLNIHRVKNHHCLFSPWHMQQEVTLYSVHDYKIMHPCNMGLEEITYQFPRQSVLFLQKGKKKKREKNKKKDEKHPTLKPLRLALARRFNFRGLICGGCKFLWHCL